jgi:hypothetical protein
MSLARITTVQSQKSITFDTIMVDETIIDPPQDEVLEKGNVVNPEDDYEGIHNRGWICAMGSFTINFFVSGSTLTFGNYMNKQVFNHPIPFLHPWQTRLLDVVGLFAAHPSGLLRNCLISYHCIYAHKLG